MSCWIISDNTINKLVEFFVGCSYSNEEFKPQIDRILKDLGYNLNYDQNDLNPQADKLGSDLKTLNLKAWNNRYNKKTRKEEYKHKTIYEKNLFQIYKSLGCLVYQCSEGNNFKDPLYKAIQKIERIIGDHIIYNLEEFKNAKWE